MRGIYDSGELGRIESVLEDQRNLFNEEDGKQENLKTQSAKYGVIALGTIVLLISLKLILNGRTRK